MAVVLAQAVSRLGSDITLVDRFYDPRKRAIISIFELGNTGVLVEWNEEEASERRRYLAYDEYNPSTRGTWVQRYGGPGLNCYDRVHADPPTQAVEIAIDLHPLAGNLDDFCLDHNTEAEDGEPKLCRSDSGTEDCGANEDDPECREYADSASEIYPGYPNSEQPGRSMNTFFWIHDLARFANDWWPAIDDWYGWTNRENLKVVISTGSPCSSGGACWRDKGDEYRIILPWTVQADLSLQTMAHEYGHVIHGLYGWNGSGNWENAVDEGLADLNTLRYALWRAKFQSTRPHDSPLDEMLYVTAVWNNSSDHRMRSDQSGTPPWQVFSHNGEAVPVAWNTASEEPYLTYTPWLSNTPCNIAELEGSPSTKYICGSTIGLVYWTLAFNRIRVPYGGLDNGLPILYVSGYEDDPGHLANAAFTYAITTMPDGGSVGEFMDRVEERYVVAYNDGWINADELYRVRQVLGVHCLGLYGKRCNNVNYHKTVGQVRPALHTYKMRFENADAEHFIRAEEMEPYGTPLTASFGTLGDGFGYLILDSSDDALCAEVPFLSGGLFQLQGSFRGNGEIMVQVGPNDPTPWAIDASSWRWSATGPTFSLSMAGGQNVWGAVLRDPPERA